MTTASGGAITGSLLQANARRQGASFELTLFLPAFVFVVAVSFIPFGYALVQSLYRSEFLDLGKFVGIGNYVEFLTDRPGLDKTLIFVAGCLLVTLPLGFAFALLLNEIVRFRRADSCAADHSVAVVKRGDRPNLGVAVERRAGAGRRLPERAGSSNAERSDQPTPCHARRHHCSLLVGVSPGHGLDPGRLADYSERGHGRCANGWCGGTEARPVHRVSAHS